MNKLNSLLFSEDEETFIKDLKILMLPWEERELSWWQKPIYYNAGKVSDEPKEICDYFFYSYFPNRAQAFKSYYICLFLAIFLFVSFVIVIPLFIVLGFPDTLLFLPFFIAAFYFIRLTYVIFRTLKEEEELTFKLKEKVDEMMNTEGNEVT